MTEEVLKKSNALANKMQKLDDFIKLLEEEKSSISISSGLSTATLPWLKNPLLVAEIKAAIFPLVAAKMVELKKEFQEL